MALVWIIALGGATGPLEIAESVPPNGQSLRKGSVLLTLRDEVVPLGPMLPSSTLRDRSIANSTT